MKINKISDQIKETLIILVLYKKYLSDSISFQSLDKIFTKANISLDLFVYDNSPKAMVHPDQISYNNLNIHYIHDASNSGLSKAYNEGYKAAKKLKKKWLLLLDQDTSFTEELFFTYFNAINKNRSIHLFAPFLIDKDSIFSPCKYYFKRGFKLKHIEPGIHSFKQLALLNSCMLLSTESFKNNHK